MTDPERWLRSLPQGLYCEPGDFFIDPLRPVSRAVMYWGDTLEHRMELAAGDMLYIPADTPHPWNERQFEILGAAGGWTAQASELFAAFAAVLSERGADYPHRGAEEVAGKVLAELGWMRRQGF